MYKLIEKCVDEEIARERNEEVGKIESEISEITAIMLDLASMVEYQGEELQISTANVQDAKENVEESVIHLEESVKYTDKRKQIIKNAVLLFTGLSLGALGFIAGPVIGAITVITGTATGGTIAFLTKN
jgi:t-SNARE complex subunit (syntaxin)